MASMFYSASSFNQDISRWNTASVSNMSSMFARNFLYASNFNQDLAAWNVQRVIRAGWVSTWTGAATLSACNAGAIYTAWGATFQGVWPTLNFACAVGSVLCALCITNGNIGNAVTAWAASPSTAVTTYGNIGDWNTAAVTRMVSLFANQSAFNQPIGHWNTASVTTMDALFRSASAFNQPLGTWNVAAVTSMDLAFDSAASFSQSIIAWNVMSVTSLSG